MRPERFKPPRGWSLGVVPLGLGLGLSTVLFIAGLGLRWPVLLGALLPPLAAGHVWKRRQRQLMAVAIASGDLLDPWILQQRLAASLARPPREPDDQSWWEEICAELEAMRRDVASCAELDPTSTVSLLLLLESWLDRVRQATGSAHWRTTDLVHRLDTCRAHLALIHDQALIFRQRHPNEPVFLLPIPGCFLP
ncbi:MAG: hypothetical protein ACK6AD_14020 [Cyanobacteriota bacterium]